MTHEQRAKTLRITLDQLMQAESVCVGCEHHEGVEDLFAKCCRKGGTCATKKRVRWDGKCPIGKWDNTPPKVKAAPATDDLLSLQVRYLKQKRAGITLGGPVLTQEEQRRAATSLRG